MRRGTGLEIGASRVPAPAAPAARSGRAQTECTGPAANASAMLALRLKRANGEWPSYWDHNQRVAV